MAETPPPEEETRTWLAFATEAFAILRGKSKKRADDEADIARTAVQTASAKIGKGVRTRQFVQSSFWTDDLLPWLQDECGVAMRPWTPGNPDVPFSENRVNALYFYASGKSALVGLILATLKRWIDEGEEAQRWLDYEKARHDRGVHA